MAEEEKPESQAKIIIKDYAYNPPEMTVKKGMIIEFTNQDDEEHSVTSRADSLDIELEPGETQVVRFDMPGTFEYYCKYHPTMQGVVEVEE